MSRVVVHPATKGRLDSLLLDLPQSLLLSGKSGVGLLAIARGIAAQLHTAPRVVLPEKDEKVDLEKGVISVDSIRRLYQITKTIETGRRIIIIDYTERMGSQAQNAFLKLLEEPGRNTYFILLTHEVSKLLPTIRSRAQHLEVQPVTLEQSESVLDELKVTDAKKRSQLLFIASGLPAELHRLASDDSYFDKRVQVVRDAREFLQGSPYDRLKLAQAYKDNRPQALLLLSDALRLLRTNVSEGKSELLPSIDALLKAYERIEANGNIRLQLASAMV